jgi:hypothetical protein
VFLQSAWAADPATTSFARGDLHALLFLFSAALLTACGGGNADPVQSAHLIVTVEGCDTRPAIHDSGQVVYLVVEGRCTGNAGGTATVPPSAADRAALVTLGFGTDDAPDPASATQLRLRQGEESEPVAIPGLGTRRVGLFGKGQWRKFDNTDSWQGRDGAGLLVLKGELYLLGGWLNGPVSNEVWKTSDLSHWQFLGNAPWPARHGAAWLVHDGRLWVIGGDLLADVWSSPDGVRWTEEAAEAPFGARYTPNAASLNGEIVVYAGQDWQPVPWCHDRPDCMAHADRSVWKSRDGRTWTLAMQQAPWQGRGLIHGSIVHDGEVFLIGGGLKVAPPYQRYTETSTEFTDIWSTLDGIVWRLRSAKFSFPARTHFSVVATPLGCFVSDGSVGTQDNLTHDLLVAADCLNFAPVPTPSDLGDRHASSLAYFNGSLVLLGGPDYGGAGTAVWQYFP